jgi:hypothetical protein
MVSSLAASLPGLAYSLADFYGLTEATFADPEAVGYTDITAACCRNGRLGAEEDCLPNSTLVHQPGSARLLGSSAPFTAGCHADRHELLSQPTRQVHHAYRLQGARREHLS